MKRDKGSIGIFVLIALLFMSGFLLILFASNVNKSKIVKEQFNTISDIYAYNGGEEGAYEKAYTDLRKKNKQTMTASSEGQENTAILELNRTFNENIINYRIYGNISEQALLPEEYQQVEYIESTGTQYINTSVIPNINQKYSIKYSNNDITSNQVIFGSRTSGTYNTSNDQIYININNGNLRYYSGTTRNSKTAELDKVYEETYLANSGSFDNSATYSFTIFSFNNIGKQSNFSYTKLYYLKIYENDVLIRDFIPCYQKLDNEIGLYDLVNDVFYTNEGTGTFNKGSDATTTIVTGATDTNYEEYQILLELTNENGESKTTNIYLNEPLRKVGDLADYIDFKTGKVVRYIGKIDSYNGETITTSWISSTGELSTGSTVYYVLETPTEETIDLPQLELYEDHTKIEILTNNNISPSKIEVEYSGYTLD